MIEAKVPKDIRMYETKILGPLTLRQAITVVCMGVTAFLTYGLCCGTLGLSIDAFIYVGIIPSALVGFIGLWTIDGVHLEKYIKTVLVYNFLAPGVRKPRKQIYKYNAVNEMKLTPKELKRRKNIIDKDPQYKAYL